ncbi:MAG TPA: XdhC family protein [Longimicrobiales bacterium]|nr:XdhC family protein [Longimicrobiales bacterium]
MSDVVTPADAAHAVLAVAAGGPAIAVAAAVDPAGTVERIIVGADGIVRGRIRNASLHEAAVRRARQALASGDDPGVETIHVGDTAWLLYVESHHPPEQLIIVGAGHIAVPLAHLGVLLDFQVTVLDDREEFATADRFDAAVTVRRADFAADPFAGVEITDRSYIALVTRGHRWDFDCLRRLVSGGPASGADGSATGASGPASGGAQPRYIGMVGSRRRVRAAFHALLEAGVPRSVLAGIHAPIGVEIGAETPAEIAVSISAELVAVRRGRDSDSISVREQVLDRFLKEPT